MTADFGFAPALGLTKRQVTVGPVYEARQVTYSLTVTNNLPGSGTGIGQPVSVDVWARNLDSVSGGAWGNATNLYNAASPDGRYAEPPFSSQPDMIAVTDFRQTQLPGAVTNVSLILPVQNVSGDGNPYLKVEVYRRGGTPSYLSPTNVYVAQMPTNGTWVFPLSNLNSLTWADFNSSNLIVKLTGYKNGSNPTLHANIDAAGLRLITDQTQGGASGTSTLNPVPLSDTYNVNKLQFVSATPAPSSVTTNGTTGTLYWSNVGPLYPGGSKTATVTFLGIEPPGNAATMVTNTAFVTNALFTSGRPANPKTSQAITNFFPTGVIGDTVWRDQNKNGIQETNEVGIANVKVVLTPPLGGDAGAGVNVSITNTTDRNGYYLFTGIANTGRYTVAVLTASLPNGGVGVTNTWTEMTGTNSPANTTTVTNLFPAATDGTDKHLTADFGYYWGGATINGLVWNDLNRSGTLTPDSGEYGLTNVTVYLVDTNTLVKVATNKTDATGYFNFTGNYIGTYYVVVTTNTGPLSGGATWTQTYDTDGLSTAGQVTVPTASGTSTHVDFSYYQTGPYAIGDTLYYDWNGNGVQNSNDEGIASVPVWLYRDSNSNGVVDVGVDVLMVTTNTDAQGHYVFTNYPSGNYLVVVPPSTNLPPLYAVTADPYGAMDGLSLVTVVNANNVSQDFGYQPSGTGSIGDTVWRDLNADGTQSGPQETGITNVTVWLYADMNRDGTYVLLTSTNTDANGQYLFSALPDGRYKVVVNTASPSLPKDSFNTAYAPATATNVLATVSGGSSVLTADFGFAALGAIGDTIFYDNNANGSQDWNEGGITNVTVNLYRDVNTNGAYDAGIDTFSAARTTSTNGAYLFTALARDAYVVVVDTNGAPLAKAVLTAAPGLDGQPLPNSAQQSIYIQYGVDIAPGTAFLGADFGFRLPGVIGETVWIDTNGNGVRDAAELGIANIGLVLSNATTTVTNRTDVNGYYSFQGVADGTYSIRVATNDVSFPSGLYPTCDPDGTNTANIATSIVISSGHIISVGGVAHTNFDMSINFGYQYTGNNFLSGTVGLDGTPQNGVLGTGISGVSTDEVAFVAQTVNLYVWRDANSNGVIDAAETVQIGSTQTSTNGDYAFTGLPNSVGSGTNRYIVSLSAPAPHLTLTTTNGSTSALSVVSATNSFGDVLSAYQVVAITAAITNIDFAFKDTWLYDFGDLPVSYSTLLANDGAQNRVLAVPDLYLGATVTTEIDGKPSAAASLDAGDDGVVSTGIWQNGANGAVLKVTVGKGSGWLVGYVDFNRNGSFVDAGDMVFSQAVVTNGGNGAGVYTLPVTVPAGAISATNMTTLYARFRLLPEAPAFPELAFSGLANDGETEDYRWDLGTVGDTVWQDSNGDGVRNGGEPPLSGVRVYADLNSNGVWNVGEPYSLTDANGVYGIGGFPSGSFSVAVDTTTLPAGLVATCDADGTPYGKAAVALTAGQVVSNIDFGYVYPTTVSGAVRVDVNGNGTVDAGDVNGLAGVTVQLLDVVSNVVATAVTGVDGGYSFTNVLAGSYTVREVDPAGYFSTTDKDGTNDNRIAVAVVSGTPNSNNMFYDAAYATLGGLVFADNDRNGVMNGSDFVVTNVTITITGTNTLLQPVTLVVTTDTNGVYAFPSLPPGTYTLTESVPAAYAAGTNQVGNLGGATLGATVIGSIVVAPGATGANYKFSLYTASLGDYVWNDLNGDGVQNASEPPLAGVRVYVDSDDDDTWEGGEPFAITDANGAYNIVGLAAGPQTVRVDTTTLPNGAVATADRDGTGSPHVTTLTLAAGASDVTVDFGYKGNTLISDLVWIDNNGNGNYDVGEPGISGVTVYIDLNGDGVLQSSEPSAVTDANGLYAIAGLAPATYRVSVTSVPASYTPSYDYDGVGTPNLVILNLLPNHVLTSIDFGYLPPGSVSGTVVNDANGNGAQNTNELGIAGVLIVLYRDNGTVTGAWDVADSPVATNMTDASGNYDFTNVAAGAYIIRETDPAGAASTGDKDANFAPQPTDATGYNQIAATVATGGTSDGNDFYDQNPTLAAVSGAVYLDTGAAGWGGDTGMGGVTVNLYGDSNANGVYDAGIDPLIASTVTAPDGSYAFLSLPAGTYFVRETDPAGATDIADTGDPFETPVIDNQIKVTLSGTNSTGNDFLDGNVALHAIQGYVHNDLDADGDAGPGGQGYETGEPLITNVVFKLYLDSNGNGTLDAGEPLIRQIVSADGNYSFTNLVSGDYLVWKVDNAGPPLAVSSNDKDGGLWDSISVTNLNANSTGNWFLDCFPGAISGFVYYDVLGNGTYDVGTDVPLENVDVRVTDVLGVEHLVVTGPDGVWSLEVPPGTASVDVQQSDPDFLAQVPAGYVQTDGSDPTVVTAVAGQSVSAGSDGYYTAGTVTGHLYVDVNGNGVQNLGEPSLTNVTVTVSDSTGGVHIVSSDDGGNWSATVPPGAVSSDVDNSDSDFVAQVPAGYVQTDGTDPTGVTAVAGQSVSAGNDGYYTAGTVTGHLYVDVNGNGVQNMGEPNLTNVTVTVNDSTGGVHIVSSDANGNWSASVPPGAVSSDVDNSDSDFAAQVPAGYVQTEGTDSTVVTAVAGQIVNAGSDGYYTAGTVTGHLYVDLNGNGSQDPGEPNLIDVTVTVNDSTGGVHIVSSDAGGNWIATVPPGAVSSDVDNSDPDFVAQVPAGYVQTEGTDPTVVTALAGTSVSAGNDGYSYIAATIGDRVWEDLNGNGAQDAGEPGMTNVTVRLLNAASNVVATTVTDVNGAYLFTNLFPTTCLVQFVAPPQYIFTIPNAAITNDLANSDAEASGLTAPVALSSGDTDLSVDAGLTRPARIFGYVYQDLDMNLVRTRYVDYPVANMTVTLWRDGVQVASVLTAANGTGGYAFSNLVAGAYSVRFSGNPALLTDVPESADPERNRAAVDGEGNIVASVSVAPGEGILFGTEPINAGFEKLSGPLSATVAIRAYVAGDGVHVEFATASEAGSGTITVSVWRNGVWEVLGSVQAVGSGSNTYSFDA
ncbi:MAG: SdrD B-like domain-containing protein, partial [bacterium]